MFGFGGIQTWASETSTLGTNFFHSDVDVRHWGHSNMAEHDVKFGSKLFLQRCRSSTLGAFKPGRARFHNWEQTCVHSDVDVRRWGLSNLGELDVTIGKPPRPGSASQGPFPNTRTVRFGIRGPRA